KGLMRRAVLLASCVAALTAIVPSVSASATPVGSQPPNVTTLAVYGDAPYGTKPSDTAEFLATPAFISNVNADPDVSLVVHVGDILSGKQYCTQNSDRPIYDLWTASRAPLVYTPGDNEWADCHKTAEGGGLYNPATQTIEFPNGHVDYADGDPAANL